MIAAGAVLFVVFLVWAAINSERQVNQSNSANSQSVTRLSLADAKVAFDQKSAIFVDVRDAASFAAGHIPGSVNIPAGEVQARAGELDPNAWIVTYCT